MAALAAGNKEVTTPNMFNMKLWETSGHAAKYKANMFSLPVEHGAMQEFALKPMNCPGHCLMYRNSLKSYRDLPIRMADFGVLHRNEDLAKDQPISFYLSWHRLPPSLPGT